MERVIINFMDESISPINIPATDIFERGDYLHIYNDNDLVCIVYGAAIKVIYRSTKRD